MGNRNNLDSRIKELMREGPLVALYLNVGIIVLQETTAKMGDEELRAMFGGLIHPDKLRENIRVIYNRLNDLPDDHQPE
jgi:hypothetical protein